MKIRADNSALILYEFKMEKSIIEYKIFYSWQSDCSEKTNKIYIREQLNQAIKRINSNKNGKLKIQYDEATRNTSGSCNIKETLLDKIDQSDYFIADVTPIINQFKYIGLSNVKPEVFNRILKVFDFKSISNPNVMFELGYAVNKLGWERIILVWNDFYGKIENAPFDIRGHAALTYFCSHDFCETEKFQNKIFDEISKLLKYKPIKVKNITSSEEESQFIKRERDIESLNYLFSYVDFTCLNSIFNQGMNYINDNVFSYWEFFDVIYKNINFGFYNEILEALIKDIHKLWGNILSYPQYFDLDNHGNVKMRHDVWMFDKDGYNKFQETIKSDIPKLKVKVENFLKLVRDEYTVVDVDAQFLKARKHLADV